MSHRAAVLSLSQPLGRLLLATIVAAGAMTLSARAQAAVEPLGAPRASPADAIVTLETAGATRAHRYFERGAELFSEGNAAAAVELWIKAGELGHPKALFNLGSAYASGHGVARDLRRAAYWWGLAAEFGSASAQYNLGVLFYEGEGVDRDTNKAEHWWRRAAASGDAASQFRLGMLAMTRDDEHRNLAEALHWWRRAAAQDFGPAAEGVELLERLLRR